MGHQPREPDLHHTWRNDWKSQQATSNETPSTFVECLQAEFSTMDTWQWADQEALLHNLLGIDLAISVIDLESFWSYRFTTQKSTELWWAKEGEDHVESSEKPSNQSGLGWFVLRRCQMSSCQNHQGFGLTLLRLKILKPFVLVNSNVVKMGWCLYAAGYGLKS